MFYYDLPLVHSGQAEQGLGILRQAEIRKPDAALIQLHIAYALQKLKRSEEAKTLLDQLSGAQLTAEEQQLRAILLKN